MLRLNSPNLTERWPPLAAGLAALLLVVVITSGAGPGLDPDAMAYIGAATSLAHDGTLRVPSSGWDVDDSTSALTTWPPGFSIAMAVPQKLGARPRVAARIVLAIAAFVSASLLFILLDGAAGTIAAIAGVATLFVTPAIIGVHLSALSEPLFLATLLGTLFAMTRLRHRPLIAGIPAALAPMIRYAGVCAPAALVLWLLFTGDRPIRQRIVDAAKASVFPIIAIAAWIIRISRVSEGQGGAEVAVYGKLGPTLRQGASTLADWLAPALAPTAVRGAIALLLAFAAIWIVGNAITRPRTERGDRGRELLRATALFLVCYAAVLMAARIFVGDAIPFDFRLLAPTILLCEMMIVIGLGVALPRASRWIQAVTIGVIALWFAGSIWVSAQEVVDAVTDGDDFASQDWAESPTLQWVKSQSRDWMLFTNWPAAVYFWTPRIAHDIPQSLDTATLNEFKGILRERHGAFVAFNEYNTDYPPSDSMAHALGLVEARDFDDGKVWVLPEQKPK